jgi:hypothetical protein
MQDASAEPELSAELVAQLAQHFYRLELSERRAAAIARSLAPMLQSLRGLDTAAPALGPDEAFRAALLRQP